MRRARWSRVFEAAHEMATVGVSDQIQQDFLQCAIEALRRVFNLTFVTPVGTISSTLYFDCAEVAMICIHAVSMPLLHLLLMCNREGATENATARLRTQLRHWENCWIILSGRSMTLKVI